MKGEGEFIYRPNPDGTFDSICTRCFRKVGTEAQIGRLKAREREHVCDEQTVERFQSASDTP